MKKFLSFLLLASLVFSLSGISFAAKKKTAVKIKKTVKKAVKKSKMKARYIFRKGPRPKFPVYSGKEPNIPPEAEKRAVEIAPAPAPRPKPVKSNFFIEGGLMGGGLGVEGGWGKQVMDKVYLSAAGGYAAGSGYGVLVLDLIRANYEFGDYFTGGGLNYAMYSAKVTGIPGLGNISDKNLVGIEVFGGMRRDKLIFRAGYSTALGLRGSVGCEF